MKKVWWPYLITHTNIYSSQVENIDQFLCFPESAFFHTGESQSNAENVTTAAAASITGGLKTKSDINFF